MEAMGVVCDDIMNPAVLFILLTDQRFLDERNIGNKKIRMESNDTSNS